MNSKDTSRPGNRDALGKTNGRQLSADETNRSLILLQELIHLIGLFLIHCRQSKGERATNVLFDQMIRHLDILRGVPGHDGGILIRRADCSADAGPDHPDYVVFFGDMILQSYNDSDGMDSGNHKWTKHQQSALNQTFMCLSEQAISALYIQLPGTSKARVERLRLSMNIISRYHSSAQEGKSITFRYNQRTLTIPVIVDSNGVPDPNLTLVAALNGLSAINARSLIAQAEAFQAMPVSGASTDGPNEAFVSNYNQIFSVRSLRTQIVKPPIEVNNLPWLEDPRPGSDRDATCLTTLTEEDAADGGICQDDSPSRIMPIPSDEAEQDHVDLIKPEDLAPYVDIKEEKNAAALKIIRAEDYGDLAPLELGHRFVAVTRFLYAIDKKCQDPKIVDGIMDMLRRRLRHVPDDVLTCMVTKRQGLKIDVPGRSVLVGLVHPRLFDLISLVKEHIVARQRIAVIRDIAFDFDTCHINSLADVFGLTTPDAHHILKLLNSCFGTDGSFVRPAFEELVSSIVQHENAIFEILWCFLKETPRRKDRLDFLNAFQLIIARLNHPKQALQFLLADICQVPTGVSYTDRNAFTLSNILLHLENKELYVDITRTPDDVLAARRKLNREVKHYAAWRLETDQVRYAAKLQTIHQAVQQGGTVTKGAEGGGFEIPFLLSLEREALVFSALVGGHTARSLLREVLNSYGNPEAIFYRQGADNPYLARIIDQLQLVVRCLGRAGHSADISLLDALEKKSRKLMDLKNHPAHLLKVKQVLKYAKIASRTIASRGQ